jgi:hypothetical protein
MTSPTPPLATRAGGRASLTLTAPFLCRPSLDFIYTRHITAILLTPPGEGASETYPGSTPKTKLYSVALVRERTIPTERPSLVSEVSTNFCL